MDRADDPIDASAAKQIDADRQGNLRPILYGDGKNPGYFDQQGLNALNGRADVESAVRKSRSEAMQRARNDRQKLLLEQTFSRQDAVTLDQIARHAGQQQSVFDDQASISRQSEYGETSIAAAGTPEFAVNYQTMRGEIIDRGTRKGWDTALTKATLLDAQTEVHSAVISRLLETDPGRAKEWFDVHASEMTAKGRDHFVGQIAKAEDQSRGMTLGDQAFALHPADPGAGYDVLAGIKDPQQREIATRTYDGRVAAAQRSKTYAEQDGYSAAAKVVAAGTRVNDLPATTRLALGDKLGSLYSLENSVRSSSLPTPQGPDYLSALYLASTNPTQYRTLFDSNYSKLAATVTPDEMAELTKMRRDPQAGQNKLTPGISIVSAFLNPKLDIAGITTRDNPKGRAAAEAYVAGEVARLTVDGRALTDADAKGIADRAMTPMTKPGWLWNSAAGTNGTGFKFDVPAGDGAVVDVDKSYRAIPDPARWQAEAIWKRRYPGKPINKAAIVADYRQWAGQ